MAHDILIVDDEDDIRQQIAGILQDEGYGTREAVNSAEAYGAIAARKPSLIILDVWLRDSEHDGLQMLETIRRENPNQQVVMISGHGTFDMAVSATKMGAYDFISKPFKTDVLLHTISRAIDEARLRRENEDLQRRTVDDVSEILGNSPAVSQLRQLVDKVAVTESRVLIQGAPGVGKGVTARLIHKKSQRKHGRFVVLNCASLQPENLEHELFGREAVNGQPRVVGAMEEAHRGTLLLDEIADMPLPTQGKIARVLHNKKFQRLDGTNNVEVDVRVLATTNRDLKALIEEGKFREDLYYRLNVVPLDVPPLEARREDIPELAEHIMRRLCAAKGKAPRKLGQDALSSLQAHAWPGNFWELINVIERLILLDSGEAAAALTSGNVVQAIGQESPEVMRWENSSAVMNQPLRDARESFEREYLLFHLTRLGGNISRTAEFVGMDRAALHRKLKLLGVNTTARPQRVSA